MRARASKGGGAAPPDESRKRRPDALRDDRVAKCACNADVPKHTPTTLSGDPQYFTCDSLGNPSESMGFSLDSHLQNQTRPCMQH